MKVKPIFPAGRVFQTASVLQDLPFDAHGFERRTILILSPVGVGWTLVLIPDATARFADRRADSAST